MSLQRFSFRGEHTHTLMIVAVSLYEQIQDHIHHHTSWQSSTDLKIPDQVPSTIFVSYTRMKGLADPRAAPSSLYKTQERRLNRKRVFAAIFSVVQLVLTP